MKPLTSLVGLFALIALLLLPQHIVATSNTESWTVGPWKTQEMFAWGSDLLVVDFEPNGLWKHGGSWTKLSYLDPGDFGNMTGVRGSRLPLEVNKLTQPIEEGGFWF